LLRTHGWTGGYWVGGGPGGCVVSLTKIALKLARYSPPQESAENQGFAAGPLIDGQVVDAQILAVFCDLLSTIRRPRLHIGCGWPDFDPKNGV
jgi:hypothetical protein